MKEFNSIDLLEHKSFDELSKEERSFVEKEMSKEDYNNQRLILLKAQQAYENSSENLEIDTELLARIKSNSKQRTIIPLWLNKPVPAYSLLLASLVFLLFMVTLKPTTNELIVYRDSDPIILRDTVRYIDTVETFIEESQSTSKKKRIVKNKRPNPPSVNSSFVKLVNEGEFTFNALQLNEQQELTGKSTADNQELTQFLGVSI